MLRVLHALGVGAWRISVLIGGWGAYHNREIVFALLACLHARTPARTQHSTVDLAVLMYLVGVSVGRFAFCVFCVFPEVFPHECLYAGLGRALLVWASESLIGKGEKLAPLSRNRRVCVCEGSVCRKESSMLRLTLLKMV